MVIAFFILCERQLQAYDLTKLQYGYTCTVFLGLSFRGFVSAGAHFLLKTFWAGRLFDIGHQQDSAAQSWSLKRTAVSLSNQCYHCYKLQVHLVWSRLYALYHTKFWLGFHSYDIGFNLPKTAILTKFSQHPLKLDGGPHQGLSEVWMDVLCIHVVKCCNCLWSSLTPPKVKPTTCEKVTSLWM